MLTQDDGKIEGFMMSADQMDHYRDRIDAHKETERLKIVLPRDTANLKMLLNGDRDRLSAEGQSRLDPRKCHPLSLQERGHILQGRLRSLKMVTIKTVCSMINLGLWRYEKKEFLVTFHQLDSLHVVKHLVVELFLLLLMALI